MSTDSPTTTRPRGTRLPRITDEQWTACRTPEALVRALGILGLVNADGTAVRCPNCGEVAEVGKKFKIHPDGGYKHHKHANCWGKGGASIDLLAGSGLGVNKADAARLLLGMPTSVEVKVPDTLPQIHVETFKATFDPEVYAGVLAYGRKAFDGEGVRAAIEHYGQWHIDPAVVEASGAVYITRPDHFAQAILAKFGAERLVACGLFVTSTPKNPGEEPRPLSLISKKWPLVEPARDANGTVVNLQFRASNAQYQRYLEHKDGKRPYEGSQKFLNLRGRQPGVVNLDRIAALPPGTQIFLVEGFKDRLAAGTMRMHALGFPGTGHRPSDAELEVLRRYKVVGLFDGDTAGQSASAALVESLVSSGVEAYNHALDNDMDITDRLVEKHATSGCGCAACIELRGKLAPAPAA